MSSRSKQRTSAGARRPHVAEARAGMAGAAGGGRLETGRLACGARRRLFSSFFSFFGAAKNGRITAEMESEQNVWLLSIAIVTMEKRPFHKFIQFCRDSAAVLPLGATWRNDVPGYDVTDYDVTMYDIISHYVGRHLVVWNARARTLRARGRRAAGGGAGGPSASAKRPHTHGGRPYTLLKRSIRAAIAASKRTLCSFKW